MAYFSPAYLDFFHQLASNNDRDWFKARKSTYVSEVKEPFEAFVAALIDAITEIDPRVQILEPKDAIFRIYRDIRFSKDKRPYKERMSAIIAPGGRKDTQTPGFYFEAGANYLRAYSGVYQPDKEQLYRLRSAMAAHPDEFEALVTDPEFVRLFGEIRGDEHKRIPKEFKEAYARQPLIAKKQLYFFGEMPGEALVDDDLIEKLMVYVRAADPLRRFLEEASQPN